MPHRPRAYPRMMRFGIVEVGRSKSIVMMVAKSPHRFEINCVCRQKRDEAGRCRHLLAVLPAIKSWYLRRLTIVQPVAR